MMQVDLTNEYQSLLAGKLLFPQSVESLRDRYRQAAPYPHVVVDGMFPDVLLDSMLSEIAQMGRDRWKNVDQDTRERTLRMRSAADMGPAGDRLLSVVHSAAFLYLLSEITGISNLLPDPYLQVAGYAQMRRDDYFAVHSDRNVAYETGLMRRLAVIIFLNKNWSPEYHGNLELWSHDGKRCEVSIAPTYNRTAIFQVANPNYHGVPTPLACPTDRTRQSFILYYHAAGVDSDLKPHTSIFAPRLYGSNRLTLKSVARDLMPPLLVRALRKITTSN